MNSIYMTEREKQVAALSRAYERVGDDGTREVAMMLCGQMNPTIKPRGSRRIDQRRAGKQRI